jgi:hypothetical protein
MDSVSSLYLRSYAMTTKLPELEALQISKAAFRVAAAKAELERPSLPLPPHFSWVAAWTLVAIFSDRLAHYYGISTQLFLILYMLFAGLFAFAVHTLVLQRKVNALPS